MQRTLTLTLALLLAAAARPAASQPVELVLADLQGREQSVEALRGKVVVLNFWATWCIPCRKEMPILLDLQDRYGSRGLQLVAASADLPEDRAKVERDVGVLKIDVPVWVGATTEHMQSLGLGAELPATAILDRDGTIVARIRGVVDEADLRRRVDWLLGDRLAPAPWKDSGPPIATKPKRVRSGAASLVPS